MKQIVFDMDGVLFATEALSDRLWKEMMEERGTPEMTAALQQCRGRNRTDTRAFFASHYPDFPYIAMETEKRNRMLAALDKDGMPTMKGQNLSCRHYRMLAGALPLPPPPAEKPPCTI